MAEARRDRTPDGLDRAGGRRAEVVAAATDLFAERGYVGVSMDDIGAAVGMSGPAVYRHFSGKEEILAAVMIAAGERLGVALGYGDPDAASVEPAVFIRRAVTTVLDQPSGMAVLWQYGHLGPERLQEVLRVLQQSSVAGLAVVRRLVPGIDDHAAVVRTSATTAPVTAAALGWITTTVPRPRLDTLLARAGLAALAAPPCDRPMPPSRRAWSPPSTRREQIVRAGMRLFAVKGVDAVGTDEIAEAAGLAGSSLYRHIRTKHDILTTAFEPFAVRTLAGACDAVDDAASASDALARLARSYAAVCIDHGDVVGVLRLDPMVLRSEALWPVMDQGRRERWQRVLRVLRPKVRPVELALLVDTVFPLMEHASIPAVGGRQWLDEIAAMAVAHVLS